MIKGMTGFGSAQISTTKAKVSVEVKSLNHRYLDVVCYLPAGFNALENKIREDIQKNVERGRITVSVKVAPHKGQAAVLNKDMVNTYMKYARAMKKELKLENDLKLSDIIRLPGVIDIKETSLDAQQLWGPIQKALNQSITGMNNMRKREGKSLSDDIGKKLKHMKDELKNITARQKGILKAQKDTMPSEEFVSFQKSTDINEEVTRLSHFIDEVKPLLKRNNSVGKSIDFIAQEMQRETNTIGSKIQDKVVANAVITLKSTVEKIREQAQNIE